MASHYLTEGEQPEVATREMFEKIRPHLPTVPPWVEELVDARTIESENLKRRPVVGHHEKEAHAAAWRASYQGGNVAPAGSITQAYSEDARRWEGWGTALKPAHEPVCFARKPLSEKTIAANVLRWATGAINIDAARVHGTDQPLKLEQPRGGIWKTDAEATAAAGEGNGRFPANVMHDGSFEVLEAFPPHAREAIRFFYAAKADKAEREFGLDGHEQRKGGAMSGVETRPDRPTNHPMRANHHPTVKPIDLMRYLCRMVAPAGAVILDPFMGSGSTGIAAVREGMSFIGCEQSPDYFEIAHARILAAVAEAEKKAAEAPSLLDEITKATKRLKQGDLF